MNGSARYPLVERCTLPSGAKNLLDALRYVAAVSPEVVDFRLHFLEPDPPLAGDTRARAAAINRNLERMVLRNPDQYLWDCNRYKLLRRVEPCTATESGSA